MASTIISRTFSSIQDNRIALSNSNFVRPFTLSGAWTKVRVGVRLSTTDSGGNHTGTPRFALGLCAGSTNIFLDATTDNFVGIITTNSTMFRNAGPPVRYSDIISAATKVGTTITPNSGVNFFAFDATTANRCMYFVDIARPMAGPSGSGTFTLDIFHQNSTTVTDASLSDFLTQMAATTPSFSNHLFDTGYTLTVNETGNGTLDHVACAWNKSAGNMEVSDIALVQMV